MAMTNARYRKAMWDQANAAIGAAEDRVAPVLLGQTVRLVSPGARRLKDRSGKIAETQVLHGEVFCRVEFLSQRTGKPIRSSEAWSWWANTELRFSNAKQDAAHSPKNLREERR